MERGWDEGDSSGTYPVAIPTAHPKVNQIQSIENIVLDGLQFWHCLVRPYWPLTNQKLSFGRKRECFHVCLTNLLKKKLSITLVLILFLTRSLELTKSILKIH